MRAAFSNEPIDVAIRQIAETKALLRNLIRSSESFDYPAAKLALAELQRKIQTLNRIQEDLHQERQPLDGVLVFPATTQTECR